MKTFRDLIAWQHAHELVLQVYKITEKLPSQERFGLISQMQRSAVSVPANLAEGFKRRSNKEFCRHINIAQGSLEELKYYFILGHDLGFVSQSNFEKLEALSDKVGKIMHGLDVKIKMVSKLNPES